MTTWGPENAETEFSKTLKWLPGTNLPRLLLCPLFFISLLTLIVLGSTIYFPRNIFPSTTEISREQPPLPLSFYGRISDLQTQVGMLLEHIHSDAEEAKALAKFSDQVIHIAVALDKLTTRLSHHARDLPANATEMSNVDEDSSDPEESEEDASQEFMGNHVFKAGELRNYTLPKPNGVAGKKTFLGVEAVNPWIGMACVAVASNLDRFMSYKLFGTCPDDWDLAQKLMITGCDPLPRRRCFSRTPPNYTKPLPSSSSIVDSAKGCQHIVEPLQVQGLSMPLLQSNREQKGLLQVLGLLRPLEARVGSASQRARGIGRVHHRPGHDAEARGDQGWAGLWPIDGELRRPHEGEERDGRHGQAEPRVGLQRGDRAEGPPSALRLGRLEIALLRQHARHGALKPIPGRGGRRGAAPVVLFDWDRVLRPRGLLWVDRFFCKKGDVKMNADELERLRYKKLLWRVVPKSDKLEDEFFFSAVLEKPR
ncbi:uncharacterized protein J3R85_019227 [Psidium guajava]|nr:uncharacterized protein J3R85_019227 [Psidium guajava]